MIESMGSHGRPGEFPERELTSSSTCGCRGGNVMVNPADEGWVKQPDGSWRSPAGYHRFKGTEELIRPCPKCRPRKGEAI